MQMQMVNADKTSTVRKSGFIFKFEHHSFMTRQQGKNKSTKICGPGPAVIVMIHCPARFGRDC
jgi:hypothetical protein